MVRVREREVEPRGVGHDQEGRAWALTMWHRPQLRRGDRKEGLRVSDCGLWALGAMELDVQFKIFIFCLEIPRG